MAYQVIDSYYRQQLFDFFSTYRDPFYALTFELDITGLKAFSDHQGHSTYLNLCYYFTRAMQGLEDFRYRVMGGRIVLYDHIDFAATLPAPNGLFSFAYFDYHPDVEVFNHQARAVAAAARAELDLRQPEDTNHVLYTALPKVRFTGFTHARPADGSDARPRCAFGQFFSQGTRLLVPVGLEVNHIFVDGAALGDLVQTAQKVLDQLGEAGRESP